MNIFHRYSRPSGDGLSSLAPAEIGRATAAAFSEYQDRVLVNLPCKRVQVDQAWSFCYAKQKNVPTAKTAPKGAGDIWTWVGLDADTKLAASFYVGGRDSEAAITFMDDLAKRIVNRVQLTSDGHKPYLEAVEGAFGTDIDYATLVKIYGAAPEGQRRYSPAICTGALQNIRPISGPCLIDLTKRATLLCLIHALWLWDETYASCAGDRCCMDADSAERRCARGRTYQWLAPYCRSGLISAFSRHGG